MNNEALFKVLGAGVQRLAIVYLQGPGDLSICWITALTQRGAWE